MTVGATSEEELERIIREGGRKGEVYAQLKALRDRYADEIRRRFPDLKKLPRRVSGYNLDDLLPERGFHVARALSRHRGDVRDDPGGPPPPGPQPAVPVGPGPGLPRRLFGRATTSRTSWSPGRSGLEGMDDVLVRDMKKKGIHPDGHQAPARGGRLAPGRVRRRDQGRGRRQGQEADGPPQGGGQSAVDEAVRRRGRGAEPLGDPQVGPGRHRPDPRREGRLGGVGGRRRPARSNVGPYLREFRKLLEKFGYACSLYGHFGQGCIHTRIDFDLKTSRRGRSTTASSSTRPATWSSATAGRSPASTATASPRRRCCPRCSATRSSAPSASSRRSSTRPTR